MDCVVFSWENSGDCSITCGGIGEIDQIRRVRVKPSNGGLECPELTRTVQCVQPPCSGVGKKLRLVVGI